MPVNRAQYLFRSIEDATNAYKSTHAQERKSRKQRRNKRLHRNEPQESILGNSNVLSEDEQRDIMSLLSMFPEMEPGVIVNVFRSEKGNSIATIDKLLELAQEMESDDQDHENSDSEEDFNESDLVEDRDADESTQEEWTPVEPFKWNKEENGEEQDEEQTGDNEEGYEVLDEEQEQYEDDFELESEPPHEPEEYDCEEEEPVQEDYLEEELPEEQDYPEEAPEQEDDADEDYADNYAEETYEEPYVEYVQEEASDELESNDEPSPFFVTPIQATPNPEESTSNDWEMATGAEWDKYWIQAEAHGWDIPASEDLQLKRLEAQEEILRKERKREMKMALKLQAAAQMEYMRMRIKELEDTVHRVEEEKKKGMTFVLHQISEIKQADLVKDGQIADRDRIISEQSRTILTKDEEIVVLSTQVANLSVQLENREILNLENFLQSSKELLSERAQSVQQNLQKNVSDGIAKLESHDMVQQIRGMVSNVKEEVTKIASSYYNGKPVQPQVQVEAQVEVQDEEFEKALKASMESFDQELKDRASRHAMGIPN